VTTHWPPGLEIVARITAAERRHRDVAQQKWADQDYFGAIRHRHIADGLALARDHHAQVLAELRNAPRDDEEEN
jgi:hypothetical protein